MSKTTTPKVQAIELKNLDTTVKPGDDFFRYANGGWLKNNPIPSDKSIFGAFNEIQEMNNNRLKTMMEEASKDKNHPKGTVYQQIGDFFASGMDSAKIEKEGIINLKPFFDVIDSIHSSEDIINVIASLHLLGIYPAYILYPSPDEKNSSMVIANIYQGGLGMSDRDYYLSEEKHSAELRSEYTKYITKMFTLLNYSSDDAAKASGIVTTLETALAKASKTRLELRDPQTNYNKMTLKALRELSSDYDWDSYFKKLGLNIPAEINVGQVQFIKEVGKLIKEKKAEDWKLYLKWNLINSFSTYLGSSFEKENFNFYGKVFAGKEEQEPRWKRVLAETSGSLGEAVGKLFVEKYFPPESKNKMLELVGNLRIALGERIKKLEWMSDVTKKQALAKLERIKVKIGYPDKWIDYSKLEINRDSYVKNVIAANKFNMQRELNKIGKPVDRTEWGMTPQTVNAYYSPNLNEIVFPAAILQPPFFNPDADEPVNYAAIGTVIGHEMTHGFDDQGRQYDKDGNLRDWWTKEDADKFNKHVEILVEQFNQFNPIDTMHINGKLTLGENIADVGGITVSWDAWKIAEKNKPSKEKLNGFTPEQRFFLSFAQIWRQNIRDKELMNRLKMDVHSPAKYRVLGTLPNIFQFYEAFGIKSGDKMYLPPEKRAKIW